MWLLVLDEVGKKDERKPEAVADQLAREGHTVSLRQVQRVFEKIRAALPDDGLWHIQHAVSAEVLEQILPVVAYRREAKRDPLTVNEAQIVLAVRRAMPTWEPWQADHFARNYRTVAHVRSEPAGSKPPWDITSLDALIAVAHVDQEQPGTLRRAIQSGLVPPLAWTQVGDSGIGREEVTVTKQATEGKRRGGARRGTQRTR